VSGVWPTRELRELATVAAGNSAPQDDALFTDGTVPFFRTSDVGKIRFGDIENAADHLNERGIRGLRLFPRGTILFPKSGASTFLNHRVMMQVDGCVSSHLATILANRELIEPRFLLYFLSTVYAQDLVQDHAYPSLNLPLIAGIRVSTPSLAEQRRIVAILDDAFEGIATAKAHAEKNLRNAREVFEGYLTQVFSVRHSGWADRLLGSLCHRITVGHVGSMANAYKPSGVPFLRSQNIRPFKVSVENMVFIDEEFHTSLEKSSLAAGDVAIVRTGYPGTAAVIPESLGVANCSDLVIVKPGPEVDPHFLAAFFNSSFGKSQVGGKLVGAAQKHFNVGAAKEVTLHLPPIAEQRIIVAAAMQIRDETEALAELHQRKLAALDELKQSLLHQAFSGQL